jgi:hypothetical protein
MNIPRRRFLHLAAGAAPPADDGEAAGCTAAQARWRSRAALARASTRSSFALCFL